MYIQEKSEVRDIFPQYTKLVKLLLTIPGSSCTNERSFSTLRRLKTYLRSTMLQQRLNDTSILNIYSDMVSELDLEELLNSFIKRQNFRMSTFAINYSK